jgi:hypothetical protein
LNLTISKKGLHGDLIKLLKASITFMHLNLLNRDVPVTLFLPVTVTGGIVTIPAGTGILGHAHKSLSMVAQI